MMKTQKVKGYLYLINYAEGEESLCRLEMKVLFNQELTGKYLFSPLAIDPSRSVFIKERLTILYAHPTYEGLYQQVKENPLNLETFKCLFLRLKGQTLSYHERLSRLKEIGFLIGGEADMYQPKQVLGLTELEGQWLFGLLETNSNEWVSHENKPHSYSFSLSVRVSRAVANLAVGRDRSPTVGNELNPKVAIKAQENLRHYGYEPVIQIGDIQEINEHYDVAILDLPYGHFNPIAPEVQQMLIKEMVDNEARRIADELIIVTQVNMNQQLQEVGFEVLEQCTAVKGKFTRYITMCR